MTTIHRDWREFLSALLSENTRFLLIGAHALAYHVEARLTEDLDVLVEPSAENAARVHRALAAFGFGGLIADPFHGLQVDAIGRDALLKNKRASGRKKDLVDVALLEEAEGSSD
jgi:hypothetical protein